MRAADFRSESEGDTLSVAGALGGLLLPGDVVALFGELGAGKTVFCKGVGEALGIPPDRIVSPSFTIITEHREGRIALYHVDAYRLSSEGEALGVGLDEILGGDGICLVEWADRIESMLPKECTRVKFHILNGNVRALSLTVDDGRFEALASRCKRFIP